ncbi:MAG: Tad domain-containing protein [Actinobacteria bacterium]|nr:Tad domain-containing protein [Actinomycetota bacterium]
MFKIKKDFISNESGQVIVIFAILMVSLIGMMALVIDVGSVYEVRRHLQTVADSAALAGAHELPESPANAVQKAIEYAAINGITITADNVEIESTLATDDTIVVTVIDPDAPLYFAKVLGIESASVGARAKAIIAVPKELGGLVPFGFPEEDWVPGEEYILKTGAPAHGGHGNFNALALDESTGGNEYRDKIVEGASTLYEIGDIVETEPGNMAGPTKQGVNERVYNCDNTFWDDFDYLTNPFPSPPEEPEGYELAKSDSQYIIIPIIPELKDAFGRYEVEIIGFAPFIITSLQGNVEVYGYFLDKALMVNSGPINPVDSGIIRVIRLIE